MKFLLLCAALAAFCACAAAQVATPLLLEGKQVRSNLAFQVGSESWWIGRQADNYRSLERTDTDSGTVVRAGALHFNTEYYQSRVLIFALGFVFYELRSNETNLFELWRSDGTPAGDVLIAEHETEVQSPIEWQGQLYFLVNGALRRTHGAPADAEDVFTFDYWAAGMCVAGSRLVFQTSSIDRSETVVFSTDGTVGGTQECFRLGLTNSSGGVMHAFKDEAYFFVFNWPTVVPAAAALYKTNGLPGGTVPLAHAFPASIRQVFIRDGIMYFVAASTFQGDSELWRTSGTASGTWAVPFPSGSSQGVSTTLVEFEGEHYFAQARYMVSSLFKLDSMGEVKLLRRTDSTKEAIAPVMAWGGRLLLQGRREGSSARLWSSQGGNGPFVMIGHDLRFEGDPVTRLYAIAGTSGAKLVVVDLSPITDPIPRMWLLDPDEPRQSHVNEGCTVSPNASWPALGLACTVLPWLRRRGAWR